MSVYAPNLYTWLDASRSVQPVRDLAVVQRLRSWTHSALRLELLPVSLPGESYEILLIWTQPAAEAVGAVDGATANAMARTAPPARIESCLNMGLLVGMGGLVGDPGAQPRSHPMPLWSPSNRWGSGASTWNRRNGMSPQSRSGGPGAMQTSG